MAQQFSAGAEPRPLINILPLGHWSTATLTENYIVLRTITQPSIPVAPVRAGKRGEDWVLIAAPPGAAAPSDALRVEVGTLPRVHTQLQDPTETSIVGYVEIAGTDLATLVELDNEDVLGRYFGRRDHWPVADDLVRQEPPRFRTVVSDVPNTEGVHDREAEDLPVELIQPILSQFVPGGSASRRGSSRKPR